MTIRATRYIDGQNEWLAAYIEEELLFLDYPSTIEMYWRLGKLRPIDLALIACNDRYFLALVLLHRLDFMHPWLFDRCREVEADPDGYLDLWSREHYKTSIITIIGTIQDVLIDPEVTIAIFTVTKRLAHKIVKTIMQEFERNAQLKLVFPDVLWAKPKTESPQWSVDGFTVKRKGNPKEATVEGHGLIDGMPTGGHYRILKYDDIITERYAKNPDMVKKAVEAWELSDNLGAGDVRKQHAGTRYSFGDPWGQILERKILKPRIYPATEDGTPTGKPVFMSAKRWAEKIKTQRSTLNAQMLQNPLAGGAQIFLPSFFSGRWEVRPTPLNVYIMCDPSGGGRQKTSDNCAIAVVGVDKGGTKYLLDGFCHRMSLSERWFNLRNQYRRWSKARGVLFVKVGYEKYGMQADIEHFQTRMEDTAEYFPIEELNWPREGSHSKQARIERLEPDLRSQRFLLPAVMAVHGEGDCYWHMATKDQQDNSGMKNQIVTIPMRNLSKAMKQAMSAGQAERVCRALRRRDSDNTQYDVTQMLVNELLYFPFAPHDDIADAVSRIYDMDVVSPTGDEDRAADEINELAYPDS